MNRKNKPEFTTQNRIDNIEGMILQYVGHISDTLNKIMDFLEQRKNLIEQLKNEEKK